MPQFRKKPIVITAEQFLPDEGKIPGGVVARGQDYVVWTLEGPLYVSYGDWIITGVKGEKYPCKTDIFASTYDSIE